jgi:hypothetical protein
MYKVTFIILLILGTALLSRSQSAADLSAKYPVVTAYEVRPGIMMTPLYASNGQVCEMVLERHTTNTETKTVMNFDSPLSKDLVKELVDELAPPSERGKQLTGIENWFGSVTVDGPFIVTKYNYENVVVEVNGIKHDSAPGSDMVLIIKWRKRVCRQEGQPSPTAQNPRCRPSKGDTQTTERK